MLQEGELWGSVTVGMAPRKDRSFLPCASRAPRALLPTPQGTDCPPAAGQGPTPPSPEFTCLISDWGRLAQEGRDGCLEQMFHAVRPIHLSSRYF